MDDATPGALEALCRPPVLRLAPEEIRRIRWGQPGQPGGVCGGSRHRTGNGAAVGAGPEAALRPGPAAP
jgi:hypothetical protein